MTPLPAASDPASPLDRVEELVQRTHDLVLHRMEELLKPLFDTARQTILESVHEAANAHVPEMLTQVRATTLETVQEVLQQKVEPFLERTRQQILDGLANTEIVQKHTDVVLDRVRTFLRDAVHEVVRLHLSDSALWLGQRLVRYAMAGTLLCLTAIFLSLGLILGLQQAGVPPYATYLGGGTLAAVLAVVVVRMGFQHQVPAAGPAEGEMSHGPP